MTADLRAIRDAVVDALHKDADGISEETAAELVRLHEHIGGKSYTVLGFDGSWRIEFHIIQADAVPLRVLWLMVKTWWRWVWM